MTTEEIKIEEYLKYAIEIFWSEEDTCFIANVPDIKFCSAYGGSPEIVLREIKIALKSAIEVILEDGNSLPKPSNRGI